MPGRGDCSLTGYGRISPVLTRGDTHQVPERFEFRPETRITPGLGTFGGTGNWSTSSGGLAWPPHRGREYEARASSLHSDIKLSAVTKSPLCQPAQCLSGALEFPVNPFGQLRVYRPERW